MSHLDINDETAAMLRDMVVTPVTLRKMFLLLTRLHYSSPVNYGRFSEQFKDFIWDSSANPRLFIDLDYNYSAKNMDRRPAIFVGCGDHNYVQTVFDASVGFTQDSAGEEFYSRGSTLVIIRHIAKTADESLQLGDFTAQFFRGLRKAMQDKVGFTRYHVARLSSGKTFDKRPEQADQQFVADLLIELAFNSNWMIFTESHRLKDWGLKQVIAAVGNSEVVWNSPQPQPPEMPDPGSS